MAVTVAITFNLVPGANEGTITLYAADFDETPAGNFNAYFGITGPDGVEHKAFPSSPDFSFANGGSSETTFDIPLDSEGNYLEGEYRIRVKINDDGDPDAEPDPLPVTTYIDNTSTYAIYPYGGGNSNSTATIETSYDCDTGEIVATGDYANDVDDFVIDAESTTITPETDTGESASTDQSATITHIFTHTNADYTATYAFETTITQVIEGSDDQITLYIIDSGSVSEVVNVQCTLPDMCKIASCLEKEFKQLDAKACGKGWESLTQQEKGKFAYASALARLILLYRSCGNDTKYREYVTIFETLMDCSCGCGDDTSTAGDPISYTAPNAPV